MVARRDATSDVPRQPAVRRWITDPAAQDSFDNGPKSWPAPAAPTGAATKGAAFMQRLVTRCDPVHFFIYAFCVRRDYGDTMKESPTDKTDGLLVFISGKEAVCDACGQALGAHAWITLHEGKASCLSCSDLDHLVFLPSGDTALTRRARKHSALCAVVVKWSKARKRYERQGLLVENEALENAEQECAADADQR